MVYMSNVMVYGLTMTILRLTITFAEYTLSKLKEHVAGLKSSDMFELCLAVGVHLSGRVQLDINTHQRSSPKPAKSDGGLHDAYYDFSYS